jgi:protein-tyrosine-phosphatase
LVSGPAGTTAGPDHVLVLCTANRARSPVMAGLLRREAAVRGLDGQVTIDSAGLRAPVGEPLLPSVERVVKPMELGLAEHRSRPLQLDQGVRPGLVLTMTEAHRHAVLRMQPRLLDRTFTLREVLRLLASPHWDHQWDGTRDVVHHLHRLRPVVPGASSPEDVADPATGGRRLAAAVVGELQRSAPPLAAALWGPVPSASGAQTSTVGRWL